MECPWSSSTTFIIVLLYISKPWGMKNISKCAKKSENFLWIWIQRFQLSRFSVFLYVLTYLSSSNFTWTVNRFRGPINVLLCEAKLSYIYSRTTGSGRKSRLKNFKTPFFSRYHKFLPWGNSNMSKTSPKFFSKFFFNKYGC